MRQGERREGTVLGKEDGFGEGEWLKGVSLFAGGLSGDVVEYHWECDTQRIGDDLVGSVPGVRAGFDLSMGQRCSSRRCAEWVPKPERSCL